VSDRTKYLLGLSCIFVLVFLVSTYLRLDEFGAGLPFYSVDENDVVEPAAGFLLGDLNHQYYTYGPLFMYLLAGVFALYAKATGLSLFDFGSDVFFQGYDHYLLARVFSFVVLIAIIGSVLVIGSRLFGRGAALIAATLLAMPLVDGLAEFTTRIDILQALFQILAVFSLVRLYDTGRTRDYVLAGIWTGMAIAVKPIPGAVLVPVAVLICLLRLAAERSLPLDPRHIVRLP
jgi:4-amino-4-deoxy-L-arabinose transferase-like glycosyltransferase